MPEFNDEFAFMEYSSTYSQFFNKNKERAYELMEKELTKKEIGKVLAPLHNDDPSYAKNHAIGSLLNQLEDIKTKNKGKLPSYKNILKQLNPRAPAGCES